MRKSSKGPLDVDEATEPRTPRVVPDVDLRFLQNKAIYHSLPTDGVHPAFIASDNQPPAGTSLAELLQGGYFRRAADLIPGELQTCPPADVERMMQLLFIRLACLILIGRPALAAAEAIPLTEVLGRGTPGIKVVVPWNLRLLLVRLQSVDAADGGRRGIMSLYALAAEVRARAREALAEDDQQTFELWSQRLKEMGLRVADALAEMGELETAQRHLDSLGEANDDISYRKALLNLRMGDVESARHAVQQMRDKTELEPLLNLADDNLNEAIKAWMQENTPLAANNQAVAKLYSGHINASRRTLEELSIRQPFPSSLYNLGTVYDLCSVQSAKDKQELAQKIATGKPQSMCGGWEKSNADFKV
ncbi:hypothetical protein K470DRAFT_267880 [Piedraia hortae CBS 480.64]|uniref:Uncharacterized protein n=1 Tax=Piedraia hortae CBS 480.64 TaxID=1314780 RepID=A0A6A7C9D9_9PEZI|nr:hypothetical protein K470DRAFT_267880 [Piedraia hortae CBS 480.64]